MQNAEWTMKQLPRSYSYSLFLCSLFIIASPSSQPPLLPINHIDQISWIRYDERGIMHNYKTI